MIIMAKKSLSQSVFFILLLGQQLDDRSESITRRSYRFVNGSGGDGPTWRRRTMVLMKGRGVHEKYGVAVRFIRLMKSYMAHKKA